jgi:uncharacterized protein YbcC (UPF0753/DUF2309 family)
MRHDLERDRDELRRCVAAAARLLPPQGPIDTFVALNPLQGFEHLPFEEAVLKAARLYDAQPFLPERDYRDALAQGRIRAVDLDAVLREHLGDAAARPLAGGRATLGTLWRQLLIHPVRQESDAAVRWALTESDIIERLRDDLDPETRKRLLASAGETGRGGERAAAHDLWHACVEAVSLSRPTLVHVQPPVRHRDLILAVAPTLDTDAMVHPLLIRMVAAYLDQGVADVSMPARERGLLAAVAAVYGGRRGMVDPWSRPVSTRLRRIAALDRDGGEPDATVRVSVAVEELRLLGVPRPSWPDFVTASLVALRGWAAMVRHFEERPDRAPVLALPARLVDFLALRLVLDRAAAEWAATRLVGPGTGLALGDLWVELRDRYPPRRGGGGLSRALLLHQVAQLLGISAADLRGLGHNELLTLERAVIGFDAVTRRKLFHLAYERRQRGIWLDALAVHEGTAESAPTVQAVFCMDDRCESFRRHLEEQGPQLETFGAAGFFAVAMYYRGIDDWHATPLCPIVMRPQHAVVEVPLEQAADGHRLRQAGRRLIGRLGAQWASGSQRRLLPTRLALHRREDAPQSDGIQAGFDVAEMAAIVRRLLEDIGLTRGFARIITVIGHGSTSLNNPHESAYDCGACGGGRGGPNARAFALMANDPAVRDVLAATGLVIPADTVFVGGTMDTCTNSVTWFDVDGIPASHGAAFATFRTACDRAAGCDAQERCRRFDAAPLGISVSEALRHVEARAGDLAQVRPEYGHAGNALCIVGRRAWTRGLFLDRRAFLVSYDPTTDPDAEILTRTLAAVGPVSAGISLAYLFSRVDPLAYGAGTKLPHNITGLIGVMDGHASDLRTGLPFQGVEIHEPMRLVMVVEALPDTMRTVLDRLPAVRGLVVQRWISLVIRHPTTGALNCVVDDGAAVRVEPYRPESVRLATVADSAAWCLGRRDNLPPALVRAACTGSVGQERGT